MNDIREICANCIDYKKSTRSCGNPKSFQRDELVAEYYTCSEYKLGNKNKPIKIQIDFIVENKESNLVTGLKELIINGVTEPVKEIKPGTYRKLSDINNS
jgi:hypothetical protein